MRAWWANLASRERMLVAIAAALTAGVVLVQFAILPVARARSEARTALADADLALARLQEGYMRQRARGAAAAIDPARVPASADAFKVAVTESAASVGLSIDRLQAGDARSVRLVFDRADPRLVFLWLEDVQTRHAGQATRLTLEQVGAGLVRATVDVAQGG